MPPDKQPDSIEPEVADETAQWQELAKELESPDLAETPATPPVEQAKPEAESAEPAKVEGEGAPAESKPKPTYEELDRNYGNLQKAIKERDSKAKELEWRLRNYDEFIAQLRANRGQQSERAQEEPKQAPNRDEDPIGYFEHKLAEADAKITALTQGTQQTTQQLVAQQQEQQFWTGVERSEQEIRKTTPDYDDACRHLETARMQQLAVMLPDDAAAAQAYANQLGAPSVEAVRVWLLNQDRVAVAKMASQMRVSPAQLYYDLAKQAGWNAPEASKVANLAIEAVKRGQNASKTISGGGGRKASDDMALSELADLYTEDPDAADKIFNQMARAGRLG